MPIKVSRLMQYRSVTGSDVIAELQAARSEGVENIKINEDDVASCNFQEFLLALEKLQFKRVKMHASGLLLTDYKSACDLISRGVRIFNLTFHHIEPHEHDKHAGANSYKAALQSIANAYQASVDTDIPIIFQFTLAFQDGSSLARAVSELSELYPSHFRIEGEHHPEHLRAAIRAGNDKGIWVELASATDPELIKRVAA